MWAEFLEELGDTFFAVAIAGAIGLGAAHLAAQVNKERAAFDAAVASQALSQPVDPDQLKDSRTDGAVGQLNY